MSDKTGLPPRIDATPEEIARKVLSAPLKHVEYREYKCGACGDIVEWPMVLFDDGTCEQCTRPE
jgi:hypothetical protein